MKCLFTNNDNRVKLNNGLIEFNASCWGFLAPGAVLNMDYDCKLELHLRNSEVIGIPIIGNQYINELKVTSHSLYKPLQGTHDHLYFKIENIFNDTVEITTDRPLIVVKLVSKLYWELLKKKCIDGIMSVPIEIDIKM